MSDKIKPCPFCGEQAKVSIGGMSDDPYLKIGCCVFMVGKSRLTTEHERALDRRDLIARWNRRAK